MKMYQDLNEIYYWNNIKCDMSNFVAKFMMCQQIKVKNLWPGGLTQEIKLPVLKC